MAVSVSECHTFSYINNCGLIRVSDHSAIEAIFSLVNKYEAEGKSVKLKHLSEDCKVLLYKSNPHFHDVIEEDIDDPRYHLAENPEKFTKGLSEYDHL